MNSEWLPLETNTQQDHIIAHVVGATALGYFEFDEAAHMLLDIGFFWTIFVDGEMALVLQSLAISEWELGDVAKNELLADMQLLHNGLSDDERLLKMRPAPPGSLIKEVEIYACEESRRILIQCEEVNLLVNSSLLTGEIQVIPQSS
jgi:hypothetical protein